jgi:hypothetical protein
MTVGTGVGADFQADMCHGGDGLPGGHGGREVPASVSGQWQVVSGEMCIVNCGWQDESKCMSICV